jgi:hypothetical protein
VEEKAPFNMAIQDFSQNIFGDTFKNSFNLIKGIGTVQATLAAQELARRSLIINNEYLTAALSFSQAPAFSDISANGQQTNGTTVPQQAQPAQQAQPNGLLPV